MASWVIAEYSREESDYDSDAVNGEKYTDEELLEELKRVHAKSAADLSQWDRYCDNRWADILKEFYHARDKDVSIKYHQQTEETVVEVTDLRTETV